MTWLADVLRGAGLTVLEHPGWKTRGKDGMRPRVIIAHHTATHWSTSDSVVTNLLVNGRSDLPGPLCHLGLNRQGQFIVIAGGKANHAGAGSWLSADESVETIGIEAYHYGNSVPFPSREPWPDVQLAAYAKGVAALVKHLGRDEQSVCGHREWAFPPGRKPDPSGINLDTFRSQVARLLKKEDTVILRSGVKGNDIKLWQKALNQAIADNNIPVPPLAVDGDFGPLMKTAVAAYQTAAGIGERILEAGAEERDYIED